MSKRLPRLSHALLAVLGLGGALLVGSSCGDAAPTLTDAPPGTLPGRAAEGLDPGEVLTRSAQGPEAAWLPQPPVMNPARARHSANLLPSGAVLLIGGQITGGDALKSGQRYDPLQNDWATPGPPDMSVSRREHTATTLRDGRVLVVGGYGSDLVTTYQLYDEAQNAWTTAKPLTPGRYRHTATLLNNGDVLVVGGENGNDQPQNLVARYNPDSDTWSPGTPDIARSRHTATLLSDGRVLVTGGLTASGGSTNGVKIYDGSNDTWIPAKPMNDGKTDPYVRQQHTATLLQDGDVLVLGWDAPFPQRYRPPNDTSNDTWTDIPILHADNGRFRHTATLLTNGCVLIAGGHIGSSGAYTYLNDVELYDPMENTWTTTEPLQVPRSRHTATLLEGGVVVIAGGETTGGESVDVVERYTLGQNGEPCTAPCECVGGVCTAGVCDTPCSAGDGTGCEDGNRCTVGDTCQSGSCHGGPEKTCPPPNECQEDNACERTTGECRVVPKPSGTPCTHGICQGGVCSPDSSSDAAASSSSGTSSGAGGGDANGDEGCSYRVPRGARSEAAPSLSLLLLLVAARRRAPSRASRRRAA